MTLITTDLSSNGTGPAGDDPTDDSDADDLVGVAVLPSDSSMASTGDAGGCVSDNETGGAECVGNLQTNPRLGLPALAQAGSGSSSPGHCPPPPSPRESIRKASTAFV
jgi:hypothetical protein